MISPCISPCFRLSTADFLRPICQGDPGTFSQVALELIAEFCKKTCCPTVAVVETTICSGRGDESLAQTVSTDSRASSTTTNGLAGLVHYGTGSLARLATLICHPPSFHPSSRSLERLDLNFRAEPARAPATSFPLGWFMWCLVGLAAGYGVWWGSRYYLARRLSDQLATAQSPSDAFLALEGLLMLDSAATLEIARGLQHPNTQIARTAYRTLDAQITGWSQLEGSIAAARMRTLAQRLCDLPESTPPDNLVLASSLASRIFSLCLELDDPQLGPVMTACETVFQRIGKSPAVALASAPAASNPTVVSGADLEQLGQEINALRPPPPLKSSSQGEFTLRDDGLVAPIAPREVVHSSTSAPTAKVQFLTAATRQRAEPDDSRQSASASLSDDVPTSFSMSDDAEPTPQPSLVHGPASVDSQPLAEMRRMKLEVNIENIQQLEIDQLVRLLPSQQPRVAQAAALALRSRGFSDDHLALASELATSPPMERIRLLHSIATRSDLEPRQWLLWMAEDGEPEVKQQAVALLSSMSQDLDMQSKLRRLLAQETDENVAQALRKVLAARNPNSLR